MIYVIGIGPGDPSYGLLGQEAYFEKADRILGSERHLEILPPAYRDKGLVPPKKLAALAELLESFGEDEEILYLASGDPLIYGLGKWLSEKFKGRVVISPGISAYEIAQEAVKRGLDKVLVIGEQLSYEDERITILPASEVEDREYEMNVVVVLDEGFGIYQG